MSGQGEVLGEIQEGEPTDFSKAIREAVAADPEIVNIGAGAAHSGPIVTGFHIQVLHVLALMRARELLEVKAVVIVEP